MLVVLVVPKGPRTQIAGLAVPFVGACSPIICVLGALWGLKVKLRIWVQGSRFRV